LLFVVWVWMCMKRGNLNSRKMVMANLPMPMSIKLPFLLSHFLQWIALLIIGHLGTVSICLCTLLKVALFLGQFMWF
jgi:hypothetical protein